jgi:hypothetical protein
MSGASMPFTLPKFAAPKRLAIITPTTGNKPPPARPKKAIATINGQ